MKERGVLVEAGKGREREREREREVTAKERCTYRSSEDGWDEGGRIDTTVERIRERKGAGSNLGNG